MISYCYLLVAATVLLLSAANGDQHAVSGSGHLGNLQKMLCSLFSSLLVILVLLCFIKFAPLCKIRESIRLWPSFCLTICPRTLLMAALSFKLNCIPTSSLFSFMNNMNEFSGFFTCMWCCDCCPLLVSVTVRAAACYWYQWLLIDIITYLD